MTFSHSFRVRLGDIDAQGHVNNVTYLRWIQDVAVAHWQHAATDEQQQKFGWVVVRHEIDYIKQAFENEEISATTWVGEWTKVTCERFTEITRGDDLLVKARTVWCMLDRETGKPAKVTDDLIARFVKDVVRQRML
jgi:acyl-CoA thioester hydrolase